MGQSCKLKRCLSLMVGSVLNTKSIPITISWRRQNRFIYLQGQREEADTLIAFHVKAVTGNVLVRSTGADVLVILLAVRRQHQISTRQDINRSCVSVVKRGKTTCQFIENQLRLSSSICKVSWKSYHAGTVCCNDVEKSIWNYGNIPTAGSNP